jgi:hypothetical protein
MKSAGEARVGGLEKAQIRLTLDSDMGDVYRWLQALRPGLRNRELLNLIRVGFALRGIVVIAGSCAVEATSNRPQPEALRSGASDSPIRDALARDTEEMRDWNLQEMFPPAHV